MTPTVSINLCCYNSERFLEETLQSIFSQTYNAWELVVINDGSTDSTEQIIQKHMTERWPIVYHYQSNLGLGRSRNKALELSQGEFVAIIDHDDLWMPDKLEKQMTLFVDRPNVGLVYSEGIIFSNNSSELCSRLWKCRYYRGRVLVQLALKCFVLCSSIVARRCIIDEVGWFNHEYNQVEEYDLLLRIAEKYHFDYIEEPLVRRRIHENNATRDTMGWQSEFVHVSRHMFKRVPSLANELGANVLRLRLKGFSCEVGQADLLRCDWRAARAWYGGWDAILKALPRVVILYMLSLLSPSQITNVIYLRRLLREKLAL